MFNLKDLGTLITVLATKTNSDNIQEQELLKKAGLGFDLIAITMLETFETQTDPYKWFDRTMRNGHLIIQKHFDDLKTCSEIDVESLCGGKNGN